jgi:hypothetical protein
VSGRIQKALGDGSDERTLIVGDVEDVCKVPFGLGGCWVNELRKSGDRQTNLVQLIRWPLTLKVKLESESDRMNEGLYGIQPFCFWYAYLLASGNSGASEKSRSPRGGG